ncbi:MAG: Gfo/Idh/MocA family oxidoreductase [Clostridia bacterium]|nr:Gfo/Idh/MocA family oxidoreductase [Clostridia bacterium]
MIGIGLVGCGPWGLNYIRNFAQQKGAKVIRVWDTNKEAMEAALREDSRLRTAGSMAELLDEPSIQGIIIATPPDSHYALAKGCLEKEKHVLVEKPFTLSLNHARELEGMARAKGLVVLAGHLMEYHPAVLKVKRYIASGLLGELWYLDCRRMGRGKIRGDVNVLWDLAVHDIALACFLVDSLPLEVAAHGKSYLQGGLPEVVFLALRFANGVMVHIQASWLVMNRNRCMTVVGEEKTVFLDELNQEQPLVVYEADGRAVHPQVDGSQPLANMCAHFVACINGKAKPLSGPEDAVRVLAVLEAAQGSLNAKGTPVQVMGG